MLIKDLIEKDKQLQEDLKDDDTCGLCATHDAAERTLKKVLYCPHCHEELDITDEKLMEYLPEVTFDKFVPVGEWYADPDEEINMLPIAKCKHCGEYFALDLQKIYYHGGHGIYYTRCKHFLPKHNENEMIDKIKPTIEQYLNRYENEDGLTSWNLACWIARDLETYVAELIEDNYKEIK